MKFFPRIPAEYTEHEGLKSYRIQAKALTAFYREKYGLMQAEIGTPSYYRNKLIGRYLYKGPVLEWYMRVKLKMERNYTFFHKIIPRDARVLDLGCGYGFLTLMLGLSSSERSIVGIDYDEEKIATASMAAWDMKHIRFSAEDITSCNLPESDVYILNDVLHYLPEDMQLALLERCMEALPKDGLLIIRDADADLKGRTRMTRFTEFQSTRIFRFNKTQYTLTLLPGTAIDEVAEKMKLRYERVDQARLTSNITHIITR